MKKILAVLLVALMCVLVAGAAHAEMTGSMIKCTADTTLSFTTGVGNPIGPNFFDIPVDGKAAIKFIWFKDDCMARVSGQIARTVTCYLRDYTPPFSQYFTSGPDSGVVDLVTATEVLIAK